MILGYEITELSELPYLFVKEDLIESLNDLNASLEEAFLNSVIDVVFLVVDKSGGELTKKQISSTSADVVLSVFYWIYDELTNLLQIEKDNLQSIPDPILIQAGVHRLNPLGEMVTLMNLAGDDYFKAKQIGELAYHEVLWLLVYNNI